jgi:hypothetical protein
MSPRPPPSWPTITRDVGILFGVVPNERLLVRLIVRDDPVGTVITTGDQVPGLVAAAGLRGAQFADTVPQL